MMHRSPSMMAALLALASSSALAAPPATSPYYTDAQQSQVQDATSQSIGQVNMITCVMSSMRPDALVNQGPYNALIDQNVCNAAKSGGPASGSSAGATQAPDYMTAVVNSTRASNSDPMIVSAWISMKQQGTPITIFAHITATEAPSTGNPYGAFRLDYCGKGSATGCPINGYMQAGSGQLSYYEADQGGGGNGGSQTTALALSSVGTSSGGGSVQVAQSQNGQSQTQSFDFAYDSTYFYRTDGSSGAECFSRDASDPATQFSVGQYGLYDATSGNELQLNSGFPIQYSVSGQSYQGYVGYYGLSTQPGAAAPATGSTVEKVDYQNGAATTASYTLVTNGGVLTRFTRESTTLKLIDQIQLQVFVNDPTGSGLADQNTTYLVNWDEASQQFIASGEMQCGSNGCQTGPLSNSSTPIAISPSFWSAGGLQAWSQSLGGNVFIALNQPGQPLDTTAVTYYQQDLVYPDDPNLPSTLYCLANCPTAATLQAFLDQSGNTIASPFVTATYNAWQPTTTPVSYGVSGNVLTGGDGSSTPVIDASAAAYQNQSQYQNGVMSGHLVANLADAQCGTDPSTNAAQYCDWTIMSSAAVYYQWQTGPNSWNQFTAVKDASNAFVHFDAPLQVTFNVPANTTGSMPYGNYAGTTMILQYGGFGNLWGVPGTCVSSLTNQPIACNDPSGTALYVSAFAIPFDATLGVVTASANGVKTPYLVKWLQRQILLAQKPSSTCTSAGLTTSSASLPGASGLEDPSDPASSVYNGTQPTVTSAPRVIQGQVMY